MPLTAPDGRAITTTLRDFHEFVSAHDPASASAHAQNVGEALERVAMLRHWLQRYGEALRARGR